MSAITRSTPTPRDTRDPDGSAAPTPAFGRESLSAPLPRPDARVAPHASWKFQDRYELWVDWLQRDSSGRWLPYENVQQRTFRTREDTLLHAERLIQRGEFPMQGGRAAPVTLIRNRREALLSTFREAEGDGVTLIREALFPVGEYALSLKVTCERIADEIRTAFGHGGNPLRSLAGQPVKLTVLIEHPYDVLGRARGLLDFHDGALRLDGETFSFPNGAPVTGVPYRNATVAVSRGFMKRPKLYRFEIEEPAGE